MRLLCRDKAAISRTPGVGVKGRRAHRRRVERQGTRPSPASIPSWRNSQVRLMTAPRRVRCPMQSQRWSISAMACRKPPPPSQQRRVRSRRGRGDGDADPVGPEGIGEVSGESLPDEQPIGFSPWSLLVLAVFFLLGPPIGFIFLISPLVLSPKIFFSSLPSWSIFFLHRWRDFKLCVVGLVASVFQAISPVGIIPYRPVIFSSVIVSFVSMAVTSARQRLA